MTDVFKMSMTCSLLALLVAGCERQAVAPVAGTNAATPADTAVVPPAPVKVAPETVEPSAPDYEDAAGVIKQSGANWIIEVEGGHPICLPFEAPAEARADGARVRFTLYLSGEPGRGCRPVQTLVSMRVSD